MLSLRLSANIRKQALGAALLLVLCACERPAELSWSWSGEGPSRSGLVALEDGVLFGNEAGALVRLGKDGEVHWRARIGTEFAARPAVVGDTVVAATTGGEWVGVSLATGAGKWRLGGKPPLLLPLASDDERAYAVAGDGSVLAISGANGGTAWKLLPPRALPKSFELVAAPAVLDGRLLVALGPAGLYALNPEDGETRWHRELGDVVGFLAEGARIYALTRGGELAALDASSGAVEWKRWLDFEVRGGPWLARGLLWVSGQDNLLASADPQDGTVTWRTTLPAPLEGGVDEYRELVLVPTNGREGRLLGFRPGQATPVIDVRADSALRSQPRVFGDEVLVQASDGRVLAWQITRTAR